LDPTVFAIVPPRVGITANVFGLELPGAGERRQLKKFDFA
jgi:hypothetical protein